MYAVAKTFADHSMVTVTGVVSDVDWFDNTYENQGQTAGLIVADNGKELLILVDAAASVRRRNWRFPFTADGVCPLH